MHSTYLKIFILIFFCIFSRFASAEMTVQKLIFDNSKPFHLKLLEVLPKDQIRSIKDNGIGMDKNDLVSSLGNIAISGTTEFLAQLEASKQNHKAKSVNLIGQFGVGFYAAFMVAERVEVISRKEGNTKAFKWSSDGIGGFEVSDSVREEIGTTVNLFVKKSEKDYLKRDKLVEIVKNILIIFSILFDLLTGSLRIKIP